MVLILNYQFYFNKIKVGSIKIETKLSVHKTISNRAPLNLDFSTKLAIMIIYIMIVTKQ